MKRAQDVLAAIARHIAADVATFSEADQLSGYAQWMARWWNQLPKEMTDEQARVYLGIQV